jgi:hypothetical protein
VGTSKRRDRAQCGDRQLSCSPKTGVCSSWQEGDRLAAQMRLLVLAGVVVVSAVILKINWDSWRTVRAATVDLDYVDGVGDEQQGA